MTGAQRWKRRKNYPGSEEKFVLVMVMDPNWVRQAGEERQLCTRWLLNYINGTLLTDCAARKTDINIFEEDMHGANGDMTEACQLGKITSVNTQRRVTFHLPDGSQESCSDSGLGDPEPSSTASNTQPLPISFPQEEYYEQTSPNSRTEGDGNSDPESTIEVNLQKALAEASETCTQECLILGHSDSCWMPPALAQFQGPGSNSPTSTPTTTAITGTMPSFGFQQSFARGAKANMGSMGVMDGRHTLGRSVPKKDELDKGINRPQFYNTLDRHCGSKKEDPVKVIPLASFSSPGQQTTGGGSGSFLHEHQL